MFRDVDGVGTPLVVGPGKHSFRLTYIKHEGPLALPKYLKTLKFNGSYPIHITTAPGKVYAPVFRERGDSIASEMCIVEVDQESGGIIGMKTLNAIRAARDQGSFLACATPTIPPESDFTKCENAADTFNC